MKQSSLALGLCFILLPWQALHAGGLVIQNAWIRQPPPGASATAGYMDIVNQSDDDYYVTGAQSPRFGSIELHESVEADGMARMVHHHFYRIPANTSFAVKPGSYHLMLFKWTENLQPGETVPMSLKLGNGNSIEFAATVRRPQ